MLSSNCSSFSNLPYLWLSVASNILSQRCGFLGKSGPWRYVPVRFLVEKLGASVKWDGSKNQVIILRQKGTDTYAEYPTTLKSQDEWRKILENDRELIEFYGGFHLLDVGETGGIYQYAVYYHNPRNGPTLCGMMYLNPYSGRYRFNDILNNEKLSKVINK